MAFDDGPMTRRPANQRFDDLTTPDEWPPHGEALAAAIAARMHPARRALQDYLVTQGPASVGRLARATGLAPGSVSYHVRVLAESGFVEPAPELAGDTRESWWRAVARPLTWDAASFGEGSAGRLLGDAASDANLTYLLDAVRRWRAAPSVQDWQAQVSDALVMATVEQLRDFEERLSALLDEWTTECRRSQGESVERAPRRPVRVVSLVFPEAAHHG
ncbi:helix-turn-helix transcriptional regulator [Humibacter ginsenosidimutans]|uniref:Helix-turn-helix transcriptional regulator n=2 Tax=Humibacter ginsenosidimutans TaxID=2599293 RepID=A0A5B8M2E7_9MICO|nr:helix-turn-helix transcriptional regulator [Humibacter ginsenosidimutans]